MSNPVIGVLFLCTGNSARSQMAEAILRHDSGGRVRAESAGTDPQPEIHPKAREAVRRLLGVEMVGQHPKSLDECLHRPFDYVITVCDAAAESCPVFPGRTQRIHWSFPDPAAVRGTEEEQQHAFDATAARLRTRIAEWLAHAGLAEPTASARAGG